MRSMCSGAVRSASVAGVVLAALVLTACSQSTAPLPSDSDSPEGRWVYQWMLLDAGPLTGLSGVQAEPLPRQAVTLATDLGAVRLVDFAEARAWTEGEWQWRRRTEVQVEVSAEICNSMASPFEPAFACPRTAVLQERLLRPDPNYVPRRGQGPFMVARAGPWLGRLSPGDQLRWSLADIGSIEPLRSMLAALRPIIGPATRVSPEDRAHIAVQVINDRVRLPWGLRVSRALDPETGQILTSDVFIARSFFEIEASELAERVQNESEAWRARSQQALERTLSMQQARLTLSDDRLARFRARPGAEQEDLLSALGALPEPVQTALEHNTWPLLLHGAPWPLPASPAPSLARVLKLRGEGPHGEGWGQGYAYPRDVGTEHYEPWLGLDALSDPTDAPQRLQDGLRQHILLVGVLRALGLEPNPAASSDYLNYPHEYWTSQDPRLATSSVLDALPPVARPSATAPGRYDIAALRWLYRGEVAVFDDEMPSLDGVPIDDAAVALCGDCGGREFGERLSNRRFVGVSSPESRGRAVPFASCAAQDSLSQTQPGCRLDDLGPSLRASFAERWLRWSLAFPTTNQTRVLGGEAHPDFLARAELTVQVLRAAAVAAEGVRSSDRSGLDATTTAALGINFVGELVGMPRPGRYCPWPDTGQRYFLPHQFLLDCDESIRIDSPQARAEHQIELTIGPARPGHYDGSDYDDLLWHPGAVLDRQLAIWLPYMLDAGTPASAGLLASLFEPELRAVLGAQAIQRWWGVAQHDLDMLGARWCPYGTDVWPGRFQPRQVIPLGMPSCEDPRAVYVATNRVHRASALVAGHLWNGFGPELRVFVDDDPQWQQVDWATAPGGFCEVVHPRYQERYRAIGTETLGCKLVDNAREVVRLWNNDAARDSIDHAFKMLDLARTLRRSD